MSRTGKKPIKIPKGVKVEINGSRVKVVGPKGSLERELHPTCEVVQEGEEVKVSLKKELKADRRFHGLTRSLLNNMIIGCESGFSKTLTLVGVGYRAAAEGKGLKLSLGFSHPVIIEAIDGIDFKVEKNTTVIVSGISKEAVGQTAARLRSLRPPEPYHGKGVRYADEHIATKVGKSSGKK